MDSTKKIGMCKNIDTTIAIFFFTK